MTAEPFRWTGAASRGDQRQCRGTGRIFYLHDRLANIPVMTHGKDCNCPTKIVCEDAEEADNRRKKPRANKPIVDPFEAELARAEEGALNDLRRCEWERIAKALEVRAETLRQMMLGYEVTSRERMNLSLRSAEVAGVAREVRTGEILGLLGIKKTTGADMAKAFGVTE